MSRFSLSLEATSSCSCCDGDEPDPETCLTLRQLAQLPSPMQSRRALKPKSPRRPVDSEYDNEASHAKNSVILQNLNPAQCQAVTQPSQSITRVLAGPGSGKTRVLTCRIAHLLQQSSDSSERILAVTFTRKAAAEMQQRLRRLLLKAHHQQQQPQTAAAVPPTTAREDDESVVEIVEPADGASDEPVLPDAVQRQLRRVTLGTFHSVCARILRFNHDYLSTLPSVQEFGNGQKTSLDSNFAIVDAAEQFRLVRQILKDKEIKESDYGIKRLAILVSAISNAKEALAHGKDPFASPHPKEPPTQLQRLTAAVYAPYRSALFTQNQVDFDDLIYLTRELLLEHDAVRQRLQRQWTHVLVDEFQDTSLSQLDLVRLLTSQSLLVVGDADQSIYSWRGAHVGMMHDFQAAFAGRTTVDTIYLMENYRSTSRIVQAAQRIISAGNAQSVEAQLRQDMVPQREKGAKPRVLSFEGSKEEAEFVVESLKDAVETGKYDTHHEAAILYRTNAQSRALEEACVQYNLPYVVFGSATSFYQRLEVKDCLAYLRWLANGRDWGALQRVLGTVRGIGSKAVADFEEYSKAIEAFYQTELQAAAPTLLDLVMALTEPRMLHPDAPEAAEYLSTRMRKAFDAFSRKMRSIHDMAQENSVEKVLAHIVDSMGLLAHFDKSSKTTAEFEERKANVRELQNASRRYTSSGPCLGVPEKQQQQDGASDEDNDAVQLSPLATFLEDVALVTDMAEASSKAAGNEDRFVAKLMTIHAAKGMEFDTVFVVGNEDGVFPTHQAIHGDSQDGGLLEEERRLCYVAMTRAKRELIMTYRREVPIFTEQGIRYRNMPRSRFLNILAGKQQQPQRQQQSKPRSNKRAGPSTTNVYGATSRQQQQQPRVETRTRTNDYNFAPKQQQYNDRGYPRRRARDTGIGSTRPILSSSSSGGRGGTISSVLQNNRRSGDSSDTRSLPQTTSEARLANRLGGRRAIDRPTAVQRQRRAPRRQEQAAVVDSSWFYPVGSEVQHKEMGRGIVVPLEPSDLATSDVEMPVRVKFRASGDQYVFSGTTSELLPNGSRSLTFLKRP